MKRIIFGLATIIVVFVAVFAVLVLRPVRKVKATPPTPCSAAVLNGYYAWTEFGTEFEGTSIVRPPSFWTQAGLVLFDGISTVTASNMYYVENGVASGPNSDTGSYTVGGVYPACIVTITYTWQKETYTDHGVIIFDAAELGSEVVAVEKSNKKDTTGNVDIKRVGLTG